MVAKIVLGGIVLAIAGVLAWVLVIEPRQARAEAQRQIERWAADWERARQCVTTAAPLSSDLAENLALQEMVRPEGRRAIERCRPLMGELAPARGESSGIDGVEDGWRDIGEALDQVSLAITLYVGDSPGTSWADARAQLGAAIAGVDEAYARLRKAAGLSPPPPPPSGAAPAAALAAGEPILVGGTEALQVTSAHATSGAILVQGRSGGGRELAIVRGPGAVQIVHLDEEAGMRAAGEPGWSLRVDTVGNKLRLEGLTLDAAGAAVDGAAPAVIDSVPAEQDALLEPEAAVAAGEHRLALWWRSDDDGGALYMARSHDGGKSFVERRRLCQRCDTVSSDADDRVHVFFLDDADALGWWPLDAKGSAATEPLRLGEGHARPCLSRSRVWWLRDDEVHTARHDGSELKQLSGDGLSIHGWLECGDDALVLADTTGDGVAVWRCTPERCAIDGRPSAEGTRHFVGDGAFTMLQQYDGYLLVWTLSESGVLAPARAARLEAELEAVARDPAGQLYGVVVDGDGKASVITIP